MDSPRSPRGSSGFFVRSYVEVFAVLALLFVLQAGLMPFDFALRPVSTASREFFDTSTYDLILPDVVSNVFLYFPLGALLCWAIDRRLKNGLLAGVTAVVLAAFASLAVEYLQAFSALRVSSLIDLAGNIVGAGVGVLFSWTARWVIPRLATRAMVELRERPSALMLKVYCGILLFFAAMPFSFSFDVGRFKEAVKSVKLVPFAAGDGAYAHLRSSRVRFALGAERAKSGTVAGPERVGTQAGGDGSRLHPYAGWFRLKRWARWAAESASFFLLVALLMPVLREDYGFSRKAAIGLVLWQSCLLAVALSLMQSFIISRACDVTDVLSRIVGAVLGLMVWSHRAAAAPDEARRRRAGPEWEPMRWQRLARLGCAGCVAYIAFTGLIPFDYSLHLDQVFESVAAPRFLPFLSYFTGRFDLMLADFIEKLSAYSVLAALIAGCRSASDLPSVRGRFCRAVAVCLALSASIEVAQMFNPIRVTSLTDPIVAVIGGCVGVLVQEHGRRLYQFSCSLEQVVRSGEPREGRPAALSPADELIAGLTEPHPEAPPERGRVRPAATPSLRE